LRDAVVWDRRCIEAALERDPDLTLQPEAVQSEFKVSYYLEHASSGRLEELAARWKGRIVR